MKTQVVVTGAAGFIGRNLLAKLRLDDRIEVHSCTRETPPEAVAVMLRTAEVVYHLAGVNRPEDPEEFRKGNAGFTEELIRVFREVGSAPRFIYASSIQVHRDNLYGRSKLAAEEALARFASEGGVSLAIFRLQNVFGKWCRPNYNSAVATFCHNIANGLPIVVSDPARELDLIYIDDVVDALLKAGGGTPPTDAGFLITEKIPSTKITLGELVARITSFEEMRDTLLLPDFSQRFNKQLYATYLSYVDSRRWAYGLRQRSDQRGDLAEFIKSAWFGQIFVSRTRPGVTRGDHYHHTKTEKFFVIAGEGLVRLRPIDGDVVIEFSVRGEDYRVIDIPPGYTHSITNVGSTDMITIFWASEVFDPERPDTIHLPVDRPEGR